MFLEISSTRKRFAHSVFMFVAIAVIFSFLAISQQIKSAFVSLPHLNSTLDATKDRDYMDNESIWGLAIKENLNTIEAVKRRKVFLIYNCLLEQHREN